MVEKRGEKGSINVINKPFLRRITHHKISQILDNDIIQEKEVYLLIRTFFKKYIGINYEFTNEEIIRELRKVYLPNELKEKIKHLFRNLSKVEYISDSLSQIELEEIIVEFKQVTDELTDLHYKKENLILRKLKIFIHSLPIYGFETTSKSNRMKSPQDDGLIVRINILVDQIKRLSNTDLEKAKKLYKELLNLYLSLGEIEKEDYYASVQEIYNEIKNKKEQIIF